MAELGGELNEAGHLFRHWKISDYSFRDGHAYLYRNYQP